jgi:hypothetical protein
VNVPAALAAPLWPCLQRRSAPKLLILLMSPKCLFFQQPKQSLDFQGLAGGIDELSTKLSTEILDRLQSVAESRTYAGLWQFT